jgi:hypothetical protein
VIDSQRRGDRAGDEFVGGGDDGHQVATGLVLADQVERGRPQLGLHHLAHEALALGLGLLQGPMAPYRGGEVHIRGQVQRAGLVVGVEGIVALAELLAIGPADVDHELAEGVVGIDRNERAVEVEQAQASRGTGRFGHQASISASTCRTSGRVTAR